MDVVYSVAPVFAILLGAGFVISLLSSQLQCSKIGAVVSITQAAIFASFPTVVYAVGAYFEGVRAPFRRTLESFGVAAEMSDTMALGYLVMLACWVSAVWNVHSTETSVCAADPQEMTAFKQKLMAELQQKQEEEEKNKEAK
jgi:hypothetical protein